MPENKEILRNNGTEQGKITAEAEKINGLEDTVARAEVTTEVKSWLHKIEEEDAQLKTVNDAKGQTVLQPAAAQGVKITLPVSKRGFLSGFKKTVSDAGKWLSTFVLRLIKVKKGEVKFPDE